MRKITVMLIIMSCFLLIGCGRRDIELPPKAFQTNIKTSTDTNSAIIFSPGMDFRNVKWGMNKESVLKSEKNPPIQNLNDNTSEVLCYEVYFSGHKTYLLYLFQKNGRLSAARYLAQVEGKNDINNYILKQNAYFEKNSLMSVEPKSVNMNYNKIYLIERTVIAIGSFNNEDGSWEASIDFISLDEIN